MKLEFFKKSKSSLIFIFIFVFSLFADFIANDKPIIMKFDDQYFFPIFEEVFEDEIGGELSSIADFKDPEVVSLVNKKGWMIFPVIKFSYDTINYKIKNPAPSKPTLENLLGTDDQGRDVLARIIYGIRSSLLFGLLLSLFSILIGIFFGSIQGYFGGIIDLFFQRFIEIWSSIPMLFLLIIFSTIIDPSFTGLFIMMLLFSWIGITSYVRAEFLRLRNFDFVKSAKSLGANNFRIIFKHILPNASPVIISNIPFIVAGSIITITSLDFLGFGMPVGSPSIGELLSQGKNNITCYWLGLSGFFTITIISTLLLFIAEDLREYFLPK